MQAYLLAMNNSNMYTLHRKRKKINKNKTSNKINLNELQCLILEKSSYKMQFNFILYR